MADAVAKYLQYHIVGMKHRELYLTNLIQIECFARIPILPECHSRVSMNHLVAGAIAATYTQKTGIVVIIHTLRCLMACLI